MAITIGLIVMVAALNIIASLIMLVMEKTRDIAILKTMGASAASIRRIFMLQGLIIGIVGTGSGALLGTSLIYLLDHYKLIRIELSVYQITNVPFKLQTLDFVVVVVASVLDLLPRDDLPVAAGGAARSGAGAAISMNQLPASSSQLPVRTGMWAAGSWKLEAGS